MEHSTSARLSHEAQQAIDEALQALETAQRMRAQRGLPAENSRAYLESLLTAEQLAEVRARFAADMEQVQRDAKQSASFSVRSALGALGAAVARRRHQTV